MFSQTMEYALRAVAHLALDPSRSQTTRQVAAATQIPPSYLAKILRQLVSAGLVRSQRGIHGGFILSQPPEQLNLLAVVNAVDPLRRIDCCPLHLPQHRLRLCRLHRRLDHVLQQAEEAFATTTLAQILSEHE